MILALLPGVSSHTSVVSLNGRRIKFRHKDFSLKKGKINLKKYHFPFIAIQMSHNIDGIQEKD